VRFLDRFEKDSFYSYEEIQHRARQTAGGLRELGICPGDPVAIILPTGIDFYEAFFGVVLAGAVPVALYPPFRLGRLDEYHERTAAMLDKSGARLLLTQRMLGRLLGRTKRKAGLELGAVAMEDLPRGTPVTVERSANDLAVIQFSSGTTSDPKPVRLTHRQILANVNAIRQTILAAYPEGRELTHAAVSWLPLYHDMGLVGSVFTSLAHPSDLILIPPEYFVSRPAIWLRSISRYRATVSPAPNFAYRLCADRIGDEELKGVDLSSWRLALNGAEPVTPSVLRRFRERFRPYGLREESLTPVYGLAEAALAVTFSDLTRSVRAHIFDRRSLAGEGVARIATEGQELASVGRPLPGYEVRIADEDGEPVESGRVGRVLVRGPSIMSDELRDGWLDTGDAGFLFEDELYLYGRNKDLIVLRGRNYAPQDIEHALDGLAHVRSGCLAALGIVPESGDGEELVVPVERSRASKPSANAKLIHEVRHRIADRIGLVADRVRVLEPGTLPRTSNGKIRRNEARRQYLTGTLRPPKRFPRWRLASEMILSSAARGK
jgi:acyl-CoA synthetase (AMP-forming)/AMP-acid ligase II